MRAIHLIMCLLFIAVHSTAQMNRIFNRMSVIPIMDEVQFSKQERIDRLQQLVLSEDVRFELPKFDSLDQTEYFPLDTMQLHFLDINGDDHLDLLYSGQSGNSGIHHTKVFVNTGDSLIKNKTLPGRIVAIEKLDSDRISFTSVSNPCCDSYTAQVIKHIRSHNSWDREYTLSIVGEVKTRGMPSIDDAPVKSLPSLQLYADQFDFRSTTTYFGENTDQIHAILKTGKMVRMINLERPVLVEILYTKTIDEQEWHLVLTEKIDNAPPSLYEWSQQDKMRFIGWTKFK